MKLSYLPLHAIACAFTTNAAIVNFYSDIDCAQFVGTRNIWDNTCAPGNPAFKSFMVTTAGGDGQNLLTNSNQGDCPYNTQTGCFNAQTEGVCNWVGEGTSYSIGSSRGISC